MTNWEKLKEPFAPEDIEWRVSRAGKKKDGTLWAKVLAYIDARAIQGRLDEVFGPAGWKNEYREGPAGGVICRILFKSEDGEWCWREDGADNTNIEEVKGGLSSALKRAGAALGIGRYLYNLPEGWAQINENGQYYGRLPKDKGGDSFRWDPPDLPAWALPAQADGGPETSEKPDRPDFEDLPQGKAGSDNGAQKPRKHTRPLEAPRLRDFLRRKAADYASNGRTANDKQRGLCMGMLNECFATDDSDDRRRSVLAYVFEVDSGTELTDAQVLALLDWLNVEKDSGGAYTPDGTAVTEAGYIVRARMEEIGQDALFPEEAA